MTMPPDPIYWDIIAWLSVVVVLCLAMTELRNN
jgi:hypothetical protein